MLLAMIGPTSGNAVSSSSVTVSYTHLAEADRLGGDAEAGAVHQSHDIFDQTHAA